MANLNERFLKYVAPEALSGCWNWLGTYTSKGYTQIAEAGKTLRAHRYAYEMFKGPVEPDQVVRHICDNTGCVNPEHLLVGTQEENIQDKVERNRCFRARGSLSPLAKLTQEQVDYIRSSDKRGCDLAEELQISRTNISRIRKNKAWV